MEIGNWLTLGGFVVAGSGFVWAVRKDVAVLASRLTPLEEAVKTMVKILQDLSRQDERLKAVERDVERNDPRKQRR